MGSFDNQFDRRDPTTQSTSDEASFALFDDPEDVPSESDIAASESEQVEHTTAQSTTAAAQTTPTPEQTSSTSTQATPADILIAYCYNLVYTDTTTVDFTWRDSTPSLAHTIYTYAHAGKHEGVKKMSEAMISAAKNDEVVPVKSDLWDKFISGALQDRANELPQGVPCEALRKQIVYGLERNSHADLVGKLSAMPLTSNVEITTFLKTISAGLTAKPEEAEKKEEVETPLASKYEYVKMLDSAHKEILNNICSYLCALYTETQATVYKGFLVRTSNAKFTVFKYSCSESGVARVPTKNDRYMMRVLAGESNDGSVAYPGWTSILSNLKNSIFSTSNEGYIPVDKVSTRDALVDILTEQSNNLYIPCFHAFWCCGAYYDDTAQLHKRAVGKSFASTQLDSLRAVVLAALNTLIQREYTDEERNKALNRILYRLCNIAILYDCREALVRLLVADNVGSADNEAKFELHEAPLISTLYKIAVSGDTRSLLSTLHTTRDSVNLVTKLPEKYQVERGGGEAALYYGASILAYSANKKDYANEILFGYQAMQRLADAGEKPSMQHVLIGRREVDSRDYNVNLNDPCMQYIHVSAGSRGGKGVMTLSILGTIIANSKPFIYGDGKPDMAIMLWEIEQQTGIPNLALELSSLELMEIDGKPRIVCSAEAFPTPIWRKNMMKNGRVLASPRIEAAVLKSINAIGNKYDIPKLNFSWHQALEFTMRDKIRLCIYTAQLKLLYLSYAVGLYAQHCGENYTLTILDEINRCSFNKPSLPYGLKPLCTVAKTNAAEGYYNNNNLFKLRTARAEGAVGLTGEEKAAKLAQDAAEIAKAKEVYDRITAYLRFFGYKDVSKGSSIQNEGVAVTPGTFSLMDAAAGKANASGNGTVPFHFLTIGQGVSAYNPNNAPLAKNAEPIHESIDGCNSGEKYYSPYGYILNSAPGSTTLIRGNECAKNTPDGSTKGFFTVYQGCSWVADSKYDGDEAHHGTFIKTYLTLNANDAFINYEYGAGNYMDDKAFCGPGFIKAVCGVRLDPDKPNAGPSVSDLQNPAFMDSFGVAPVDVNGSLTGAIQKKPIGFIEALQFQFKLMENKDIDITEIARRCGIGYNYAKAVLTQLGIFERFPNYASVEDWLYDINPASFPMDGNAWLDAALTGAKYNGSWVEDVTNVSASDTTSEHSIFDEDEDEEVSKRTTQGAGYGDEPDMQGGAPDKQDGNNFDGGTPKTTNTQGGATTQDTSPMGAQFEEDAPKSEYDTPKPEYDAPKPEDVTSKSENGIPKGSPQPLAEQNSPTTPMRTNSAAGTTDPAYEARNQAARGGAVKGTWNPNADEWLGGTGTNSVLGGTHMSVAMTKQRIGELLVDQLDRQIGGLDKIESLLVSNNAWVVNGVEFRPNFAKDVDGNNKFIAGSNCAFAEEICPGLGWEMASGNSFALMPITFLNKCKNLTFLTIPAEYCSSEFRHTFWRDLRLTPLSGRECCRRWRKLYRFEFAGSLLVDNSPEAQQRLLEEQQRERQANAEANAAFDAEMAQRRMENKAKRAERWSTITNGIATALGLPTNNPSDNAMLQAVGKSRIMGAMHVGVGAAAAAMIGHTILMIGNPFLLIAGAFTGVAWLTKTMKAHKQANESAARSAYTANRTANRSATTQQTFTNTNTNSNSRGNKKGSNKR